MKPDAEPDLKQAGRLSWPGFVLDLARGELLDSQGQPVELRAQALKLLLVLGEQYGQVVGKDELMRRVWGPLVVTEDSLVQAVGDIRRALGDRAHTRLRNLPKRGYLLLADPTAPAMPTPEPAPLPPLRSLAILPFEHDPSLPAWLVEGLGSDLTSKVTAWQDVFVVGRSSLRGLAGPAAEPRRVAREFGVRWVLTGNASRDGESIRLDLAMVDGRSGHAAWAQQFHLERARFESSLGDIAGGIARILLVEWGRQIGEQLRTLAPEQVAADDLAMQGFAVFLKGLGPQGFVQARALFEQGLTLDPASLRALAGVSLVDSMSVLFQWTAEPQAAATRAEATLDRLENIDPTSFLTLAARASVMNMRNDWEGLLATSARLIEFYPNDHSSHHHRCSALLRLGRFDDSIAACERALLISPRDSRAPIWHGLIGMNLFMLGRHAEAAQRARNMVSGNSRLPFYQLLLAASLGRAGNAAEARRLIEDFKARQPDFKAERIASLWPAQHPSFVAGRERITETVRALGLP